MASTVLLPFVFAELPFPSLTSVDPSLLTFTEALESVEEDSLVTLLDDVVEVDESVLSLELPHAAKVNKARTETEAKVNLKIRATSLYAFSSFDRYFKAFSSVLRPLFVIIIKNRLR